MTTTTSRTVRDWIDARADDMADLLVRLVAVETENPPARNLGQCAEVLCEAMNKLGLAPELIPVEDASGVAEQPCIVRGQAGSGDRLVYFHGHFDVVPVQDRAQFTAQRRNGRIVGRGTADMKGGVVSMLYAAAAAQDLGLLDGGRIVINLVCDEETGSALGGEGEAHGTMIVIGGQSGGGTNFNVVPASSWFTLDGRFNPEAHINTELQRITDLITTAADSIRADASIEVNQLAPATTTALDSRAAQLLGDAAVHAVSGEPAKFELCPGCLDTRWYAQRGIPAFGYGPGRFDVSHGPAEYVEEAALRTVATVYATFAASVMAD